MKRGFPPPRGEKHRLLNWEILTFGLFRGRLAESLDGYFAARLHVLVELLLLDGTERRAGRGFLLAEDQRRVAVVTAVLLLEGPGGERGWERGIRFETLKMWMTLLGKNL